MRILHTYTVYEPSLLFIALFVVFFVVFFLSLVFCKIIPMIISGFAIMVCIVLPAITTQTVSNPINRYECIIDDDYPAKEINEKYDIIEIKGDIWVLQDREE